MRTFELTANWIDSRLHTDEDFHEETATFVVEADTPDAAKARVTALITGRGAWASHIAICEWPRCVERTAPLIHA